MLTEEVIIQWLFEHSFTWSLLKAFSLKSIKNRKTKSELIPESEWILLSLLTITLLIGIIYLIENV